MAKRVFFSFHYQDVIDFRANVVRNHWMTKSDREQAGFFDASVWEESQKKGNIALKRLINGALDNTSNTCVLVGTETYLRPWVRYEILKSFKRGNHLLAVHINSITDKNKKVKTLGSNPFDFVGVRYSDDGKTATLLEWLNDKWVDYDQIDNSATYAVNVGLDRQGKGFKLSELFKLYDWDTDRGYDNFSSWLA
ncbi:TIR domain-containing protein [Comamonas aquatica]|uniref:TIR domain-containing protein n=1 Tax=Comamonas aquatica TaxID=225991 RepID=A0AA43AYD9_9BURK|nr:TIR domain-containing protein [Comamonas aquatica]MDH1428879.1 TIR domain-containing protein [Comamonas aquatica]MDH1606604.1 TIR domain-containing protein [Comamonas aquatica]MDH1618348.1 TIR domain-containing protein [Comamonas aquatica]MDH2006431.1 TIR domain-containing protein [Comamonas aquatica]